MKLREALKQMKYKDMFYFDDFATHRETCDVFMDKQSIPRWNNSYGHAVDINKAGNRTGKIESSRRTVENNTQPQPEYGIVKIAKTVILSKHADIPEQIIIIKSGWSDFYHVIHEDPESGDMYFKHSFISETELKKLCPSFDWGILK